MPDPLAEYRKKRDFSKTPEPAGAGTLSPSELPRFVIQEHHATALHWDFRLERDGVLVSWAVPKGLPRDPRARHLAVRTEDHPLEYLEFQGTIPEGSYGAGEVRIWDSGTYEPLRFDEREVVVRLHGRRLRGTYGLYRTGERDWLIHRKDPPEPGWEPVPERLAPMLATLGPLPASGEGWAFEVKWDGVRALAYVDAGRLRLESRRGNDITVTFPELKALGPALASAPIVLDGEIVAFDDRQVPSFERLQERLGVADEAKAKRLAERVPAVYVIFDLLYFDGHLTLPLPYRERRRLLESLEIEGPAWRTPRALYGEPAAIFEAVRQQGLEGVVAKRVESPYEPGRRSPAWVKVKVRHRQEFVVIGWTPRQGAGFGDIGALLLGYYEGDRLRYAGRAGSGLDERTASVLARALERLEVPQCPVDEPDLPPEARFVRPELVVEVEFAGWTESGRLRAPVFRGIRPDADPRSVVREDQAGTASS